MAANTSLAIRIATIFDNKGLKKADKGVKGLQSAVKKLAGAAGIGLSTAAVINFGKQAAKAFIADEKAASRLALAVKNLGLGFETPRIEEFISQLSKASGVTDDQLRPSMQKLLQTTGSVAKSTEILTQALDISRGSGVEFETVVNDLSMAYVGQTRGLKKYALGISQAELKTMSFADVQERLSKQFTGANAAYLETYAGKLGILSTAAGEASETIGKGLVDSLALLAGEGNSVQPLADSMQDFATNVSDSIYGVAVLIDKLKSLPGTTGAVDKSDFLGLFLAGAVSNLGKSKAVPTGGYPSSALGGTFIDPNDAARRKAEADAAKREKELAALTKKGLDAQKKSLAEAKKKAALDKASKTLNLEAIGIEAALKGKISETDRISLLLQKAILEGNGTLAEQLSAQLEAATKRNAALTAALLATPEAPNPYRNWIPPNMGGALGLEDLRGRSNAVPNFNVPDMGVGGSLGLEDLRGRSAAVPQINIVVELDGQTVGGAIRDGQINDSLSGSFNQVNRGQGFKGAVAL